MVFLNFFIFPPYKCIILLERVIIINKLYEKIKLFIKENLTGIIIIIIFLFLFLFKLPYYVFGSGGLINTEEKVDINNKIQFKGSLNMTYVSSIQGTPITLLYALINPEYDIENINEVKASNENIKDEEYRNKLLLQEANNTALLVAYKHSNIPYAIKNNKVYVTYVDENSKTDLKIKDQIIKIDNNKIKTKQDLYDYINKKDPNDEVTFTVINNNKKYKRKAKLINVYNKAKVGVIVTEDYDISSSLDVDIHFKGSESGSSGGLMLTLTLYSYINNIDLTKGKVIAGTGTISEDGTVGEISGIKYKLSGAVKKGADVLLVPDGDNYKEAVKLKKKYNYDIVLVPISSFDEALDYLKAM